MRPEDIVRWRNALGLSRHKAGAIVDKDESWLRRIEDGAWAAPRWLNYMVAWTRLYGTRPPFEPKDIPTKMKEFRKRWGLYQTDLAEVLGVHYKTIENIEAGLPNRKDLKGIAFALAWIDFYGSLTLPFPEVAPGLRQVQCPKCLHKF